MHRIDILTIFPELFAHFLQVGILGTAHKEGRFEINVHNLRDFSDDKHRRVDDLPYGGGPGMVMKPEPLLGAIESIAGEKGDRTCQVILLTPQGQRFSQDIAKELSETDHFILVCGRYEGVDQRVIDLAVDQELSIGDYVMSGGEVPAMVVIEAVSRFVPGVLGNPASLENESFSGQVLEGPQYTRPAEFRGEAVPEVLSSGDHAAIKKWRADKAVEFTKKKRPDLLFSGSPEWKERK